MYTEQIKRRKSNAYYEMKTIGSPQHKGRVIQKLGSSIYSSMDTLQSLKSKIMVANIHELKGLVESFRKQHSSFLQKQKSLFEMDESSDKLDRLKLKVKEFLEVFSPQEIEQKLKVMKEQKQEIIRQSAFQQQEQIQTQMLDGKSLRKGLLDEEHKQIVIIQKLMADIKKIALDTSSLIIGVGEKLNIAEINIRQARMKMQKANKQLEETNQYQRDTNKTKILFCCLTTVIVFIILLIMIAANK